MRSSAFLGTRAGYALVSEAWWASRLGIRRVYKQSCLAKLTLLKGCHLLTNLKGTRSRNYNDNACSCQGCDQMFTLATSSNNSHFRVGWIVTSSSLELKNT